MRNPDYVKLINSWKWQKLRRAHLIAHPLCERCKKKGRVTAATEVHHITPVSYVQGLAAMEVLAYDPRNLMSLCKACHKEIHEEIPRCRVKKTRYEKKKERLRIALEVGNFARFLPPKEENNGTI